jgi:elongin-A
VQRAVDEDAEKLKMALDGISSERAKNSAKFVPDRRDIRLPRERPTTKQRYASYDRKMGGIKPTFASTRNSHNSSDPLGSPLWSFERPPPPRPETKKKSNIFAAKKRNNVLAVPTKHLNNRASQVRQAPRSLIEEHRRPTESAVPKRSDPPTLRAPGRSRPQGIPGQRKQNPMVSSSLQEREARLRAIASGQRPGSSGPLPSTSKTLGASSRSRTTRIPPTSNSPIEPSFGEAISQARPQAADSENHRLTESGPSTDIDESRGSPTQAPRPTMIRKRPPPSIFMQPKRKKVN